ncbi:kinase-like domain-containing protein [Aspergillus pseudodeflectus]|uniref:non-specific serine/threonine protein kinase n=1 Tax=Aspergillus pseudodeflectus TaxID=176178 RepID=A0ABR4L1Y4_9EURO
MCFPTSDFETVHPAAVLDEELGHQYVTLKVYTRDEGNQDEFQIYKQLDQGSSWRPGHAHIRKALDLFTIPHSGGNHPCLVQKPMWESFKDLLYHFLALDYLHTECKLVHTDIKSDDILQEIEDKSIHESFTQAELKSPSPRKIVNGFPVYASRRFDLPKVFGRVVPKRNHDAQPNIYRLPEVTLKTDWNYPAYIWNVGETPFHGNDPDGKGYSTRAHLAEVMGVLGPPPLDMLQRGKRSHEFFTNDNLEIPRGMSLELSEEFLKGRNKEMFLAFIRGMLQWRPEDRKTAKDPLQDPWLNGRIG